MQVMTGSGLLSSTIAPVSSVLGPLQRSVSLPDSRPEKQGAWTRAGQSRDQACVIWGKLLNLFAFPVCELDNVINSRGYSRIKGTQSVQYKGAHEQS